MKGRFPACFALRAAAFRFARLLRRVALLPADMFWSLVTRFTGTGDYPAIEDASATRHTAIEMYWTQHTVNAPQFKSAFQSQRYVEQRFESYPLFRELTGLYGQHDGENILDYGCGPGNDLVGFAHYTQARQIIGMDVSLTSLKLASRRLALHRVEPGRIRLMQVADDMPTIRLADRTIDFINCQGVLQHTSFPDRLLAEFHRVLKPGGSACLMVYNRESIWFHLYTAYQQMLVNGLFSGLDVETAFSRNTDGANCPLARCWRPAEFVAMTVNAGFAAEFRGGYLSDTELDSLQKYYRLALNAARLDAGHREFLRALTFDERGMPLYNGKYAGVSGVFILHKD